MIFLDSDIIIEYLENGKHGEIIGKYWDYCATTWLNKYEVLCGIDSIYAKRKVEKFFATIRVFEMQPNVVTSAVHIFKSLRSVGKMSNRADIFIAATMHANKGQFILTNNKKHFSLIPGIKVIDT